MSELFHQRLGAPLPGLAVLAVAFFVVLRAAVHALERSGRNSGLSPSRRSLVTDLGYFVLGPCTELLVRAGTTLAILGVAALFGWHVGSDVLHGFGPVMKQPRWAILLEMTLLSDFTYYWTHRAAHTVPALWRLHAVHHSTEHLRVTSALRAHPAEAYVHLVNVVPLFVLGFPMDAFFELAPVIALYAFYIHANVSFAIRPLSYVLNSPRYHAWHHSLAIPDGTKNFSGFFPLFDRLFGTYYLPDRLPVATGMDDAEMPQTCLAQIVYPLTQHGEASAEARASPVAHVGPATDRDLVPWPGT